MSENSVTYCVNHPKTETLLRCNRCARPVCIKCVVRTPVGYRCKDCVNIQQAGYYTATFLDYAIAGLLGTSASVVGGAISAVIGGFWIFAIFYAPLAGGVIAGIISAAIQKRRGRYIWIVACSAVVIGGVVGAEMLPVISLMAFGGRSADWLRLLSFEPRVLFAPIFNIGFLIYVALAAGTVFARLRV